jgi:hypothetical protein
MLQDRRCSRPEQSIRRVVTSSEPCRLSRIELGQAAEKMRARWLAITTGLLALLAASGLLALREGLVPPHWSPLPRLDLAHPKQVLIEWRLAELRRAPELCRSVLRSPYIEAVANADRPIENGCGWSNSMRIMRVGNARFSLEMNCPDFHGGCLV